MNILIFDDDRNICEALVNTVSGTLKRHSHSADCQVFGVASAEKLNLWLSKNKPDIVLLDIITDEDDSFGIKCAKQIRKKYRDCHIIFVTNDDTKIVDVFMGLIRPTQFIVKSEGFDEVKAVICEILDDICDGDTLKVSYGRNEYILNSSEILLIRKNGRKTELFLENRRLEVADTVSGIAKMLPYYFKFVDKGVVVNLKMVKEAKYSEKELSLTDGQTVYMSRNSIHEVKSALAELVRGENNVGVAAG